MTLTRTYGNQYVTRGRMEIEGTGFKCFTLENREWSHSPFQDRAGLSLPIGTYQVKIDYSRLDAYLKVKGNGAHRRASIGRSYDLNDMPSGSITIGKRFAGKDSTIILGYEVVARVLDVWVTSLAERWEVPPGKYGYIELDIKLAEDFKYENLQEEVADMDTESVEMDDFCEVEEEDLP